MMPKTFLFARMKIWSIERLNNNLIAGFLSSSHFVVYTIHFANWTWMACSESLLWSLHSSANFLFNLRLFRSISLVFGEKAQLWAYTKNSNASETVQSKQTELLRRLVKETVLERCIDPTFTSRRACDAKKLFIKSTESARWRISLSTIPAASNAKHAGRSWRSRATLTTNRIKTIKKWVNWRFLIRFNRPIADYKFRFGINWMFD